MEGHLMTSSMVVQSVKKHFPAGCGSGLARRGIHICIWCPGFVSSYLNSWAVWEPPSGSRMCLLELQI